MICLRSFAMSRNLLLYKRKNHPARWFFEGSETGKFLNQVTVLCETCHQICPFSVAAVWPSLQELSIHLSHNLLTSGCCQWRFVVSFRVGLKSIVTGTGAAVGLNGGFVHTVQLGANCLPGTECQAWNEINAAITAE